MLRALTRTGTGLFRRASAAAAGVAPGWERAAMSSAWLRWAPAPGVDAWVPSAARDAFARDRRPIITSAASHGKPGVIREHALLRPHHFEEMGVVRPADVPMRTRTGLLAIKCGMTREWNEHGVSVPLTVLWVDDCQVIQQKLDKPGVFSLQLGAGSRKPKQVNAAHRGHFAKHGVPIKREVSEFRVSEDAVLPVGTALGAAHFVAGQHVDIQGRTIGKGFQGPMKRWGFSGLPATHGTTKKHRAHGSIGNSQDPGRVFKGKKMAGRMGNRTRTVQCALVYKVDPERNLLWIKGQVPGKAGNFVRVKDALFKSPADQGLEVPYPAWGMGDMPEAPTEVTVAKMKDPFLTQGSVADEA